MVNSTGELIEALNASTNMAADPNTYKISLLPGLKVTISKTITLKSKSATGVINNAFLFPIPATILLVKPSFNIHATNLEAPMKAAVKAAKDRSDL